MWYLKKMQLLFWPKIVFHVNVWLFILTMFSILFLNLRPRSESTSCQKRCTWKTGRWGRKRPYKQRLSLSSCPSLSCSPSLFYSFCSPLWFFLFLSLSSIGKSFIDMEYKQNSLFLSFSLFLTVSLSLSLSLSLSISLSTCDGEGNDTNLKYGGSAGPQCITPLCCAR